MIRPYGCLAVLALTIFGRAMAGQQPATVLGRVVMQGTSIGLGYSVVAIDGRNERFTDADGRFAFTGVMPGRLLLRSKRIGYVPMDSAVSVGAGDTLRLTIELARLAVPLPPVRTLAAACLRPGGPAVATDSALNALFEQVRQNAERHRLLTRIYPFEYSVERKVMKPYPELEARFVMTDTITRQSERPWHYAPGGMLSKREVDGGAFDGTWITVVLPELADLADDTFLQNHCFGFGGLEEFHGDSLLRIDFVPVTVLKTPDVGGAVYLDPATYQIRRSSMWLTNPTKDMRKQMSGQSALTVFREIVPGVPVAELIESWVYPVEKPNYPVQEPAKEFQRVLGVRFLKGRP